MAYLSQWMHLPNLDLVGEVHDFKEITQQKQVTKAIDIVKNANWENAKVEMKRYADYQFQFQSNNNSEDKIASYLL